MEVNRHKLLGAFEILSGTSRALVDAISGKRLQDLEQENKSLYMILEKCRDLLMRIYDDEDKVSHLQEIGGLIADLDIYLLSFKKKQ